MGKMYHKKYNQIKSKAMFLQNDIKDYWKKYHCLTSDIFQNALQIFGHNNWSKIIIMLNIDRYIELQSQSIISLIFEKNQYLILLELCFLSIWLNEKIIMTFDDLMQIITEILIFD